MIDHLDPEDVDLTPSHKLRRHCYKYQKPSIIWHIEEYLKPKEFGFAIYDAIDEFSRKICSLNILLGNSNPKNNIYFLFKIHK